MVGAVRKYNHRVLAVPGNCDYPEVDAYLRDEGINLHRRSVVVEGVTFVGLGGSLPCPARTPNEYSEKDFEVLLAEAAFSVRRENPLVLVTHQPPRETMADRLVNGLHVGSESVRVFISKMQPVLCLTGHVHEGRSIDCIGRTRGVNPGPLWAGSYAYAHVGRNAAEIEIRP